MSLFLVVVMVATACSREPTTAVAGGPDAVVPAADAESPALAEGSSGANDASITEGSAPAVLPVGECSFEADLTVESVDIEQVPGDGRGNNPSALIGPGNTEFPEPLIDLDRILSGGPPPDGIPPIDRPVFQTATSVNWLQCNEPVLSLEIDGQARAYPIQVMTWHEIVNDTFGEVPVTVSYCPLCNSALAYKRDLGDLVVTFGTSGRLFNSSLVMYDRETESLWTHFNGSAVAGTLTGTQLELLPIQTTSWASFLQAIPDGLVLTRDTGFLRDYGRNPYSGYDDVTSSPFLFDGEADPRLAAKERVVGIRRGDDNVAIVLESLTEAAVLITEVDGDTLSVWHLPGTATALEAGSIADGRDIGAVGVFIPEADGRALTFVRTADGVFVDDETGSSWNILGQAIDGPLTGQQLTSVEHLDTFWFALAAFEPDTRIINE